MEIKVARIVLRQIKACRPKTARQRLILRVATRWIRAKMVTEYDQMLRLQVLEGAAGVPEDSWWTKGRRGFKAVRDRLGDTAIAPEWLEPGNQGMYAPVERAATKVIRGYKIPHVSADDLINNALMGIPLDPSKPGRTKRPAYEAGKSLSAGILDGKETPLTVATGKVGVYLARKALNEIKGMKGLLRLPETEAGVPVDIEAPAGESSERQFFEWLSYVTFGNLAHPVGKKLRGFMRKSWAGTTQEESMNTWLDMAEAGKKPSPKMVAEAVGIASGTFMSRHLNPSLRQFFKDLWSSPLIHEVQKAAEAEGLDWFPDRPDINKLVDISGKAVLRPRKRAFDVMVGRLAARWLMAQ